MPLSHLRVVEIGCMPPAAFCARIFADFGADVLKIEPPGGDPARLEPPLADVGAGAREGVYFGFLNSNKRSTLLHPTPTGLRACIACLPRLMS